MGILAALLAMWYFYGRPESKGLPGVNLPWFKGAETAQESEPVEGEGAAELDAGAPEEALDEEGIIAKAYPISRVDFVDELPALGALKSYADIDLRFEINGVVASVEFREGDLVEEGALLATLNQRDLKGRLEFAESRAEAARASARTSEQRLRLIEKMYEVGAVIQGKVDEVRLDYEAALAQVATAEVEVKLQREELEKTFLRAPSAGVVGTREVEPGEVITPSTKVGTLLKVDSIYAEVGITEQDVGRIALNQEVRVTVDAYPESVFYGVIDNILPQLEGRSRTLTTRVALDNSEGFLLPGMFARVLVTTFTSDQAIVIPIEALRGTDEGSFVFVVEGEEGEQMAAQRTVEVQHLTSTEAVIEGDIEEGDLVILEEREEISDGARVEITEILEG